MPGFVSVPQRRRRPPVPLLVAELHPVKRGQRRDAPDALSRRPEPQERSYTQDGGGRVCSQLFIAAALRSTMAWRRVFTSEYASALRPPTSHTPLHCT
eukprot:scaffold13307_cov97-Isochrysis_galbana.AAC.8